MIHYFYSFRDYALTSKSLDEGDAVEYVVAEGEKGLQAQEVSKVS